MLYLKHYSSEKFSGLFSASKWAIMVNCNRTDYLHYRKEQVPGIINGLILLIKACKM